MNNPPVGLVTPETDKDAGRRTYAYDPHLDPQLVWAGKAEHTAFEVPTVSLHVHERIDPRTIIESVRRRHEQETGFQNSLFESEGLNLPLFKAVEFYKHRHNWANRLIAGDSLLVMNSLLVKEGMAGAVQMVYFDPPYGIKYGSNFQPFVNKRDVKDGKDEDLTSEPETLRAFRDTWELGIHSYLTYLRDRLLLARELLHESGSIFVQISDENVHLVRNLMDEVFGVENFVRLIAFAKTSSFTSEVLSSAYDYLIWYGKDSSKIKYRALLQPKRERTEGGTYTWIELENGECRRLTANEIRGNVELPNGKRFRADTIVSPGATSTGAKPIIFEGEKYLPSPNSHWKTTWDGMNVLAQKNRVISLGKILAYKRYEDDFPFMPYSSVWDDTIIGTFSEKLYVVQTSPLTIQRCLLMTTDPGDLVLDITCGSGTTAFVAEQWGRRWMTCDTSRVALTLAKGRLMTATFDYYQLANPQEGISSGFKYKTVPHVTLKSIANNEPPAQETLYDQPLIDRNAARVTSPFTVEAVPAPVVAPLLQVDSGQWSVDSEGRQPLTTINQPLATNDIARSGETLRQDEWRSELLRTGIRGRRGEKMLFSRVEPLAGTRYLHADAELIVGAGLVPARDSSDSNSSENETERAGTSPAPTESQRAVVSFSPEHEPMPPTQVELALMEANRLFPKPKFVIFAAFQFDPVAAGNIEQTNWQGVTLLKAQMNDDLKTADLKKNRSSNESFWLIGQPDVRVVSGQWLVDSKNNVVANYDLYQKLSGLGGVAEINALKQKDLLFYATLSERRDLWIDLATAAGLRLDSGEHRGRTSTEHDGGIQTIFGHRQRLDGGNGITTAIGEFELSDKGRFRRFVEGLRGNHEITQRIAQITQNLKTIHQPLSTNHYFQVEVLGFDYYNVKAGAIESGGTNRIAVWMLDTDFDGRSLFPAQVFFPMAGDKEGWARLARNLQSEINEELIEAYRGTTSLPFTVGNYKRIGVKIVDDRGIESLKLIDVV